MNFMRRVGTKAWPFHLPADDQAAGSQLSFEITQVKYSVRGVIPVKHAVPVPQRACIRFLEEQLAVVS
jgi:hypothetical protein